MIKIRYAESDFRKLITANSFYQDRTEFIEKLENWSSSFPVFLRPRRFGKSLFIMTLHYYYGLEHKGLFQTLFGNLYIGQHPTGEANTYLVLSFEFSGIDTTSHESTYQGFLSKVLYGANLFMTAYKDFFTEEQVRILNSKTSAEFVLQDIIQFVKQNGIEHKVYVLIDEYDHFTNELLSFDMNRFKSDVTTNGFVRKFYEILKMGARDGVVNRIFITGVSPITMDSLTSGFNIGDNISLNPVFHNMMGFTHPEVENMLHGLEIPSEKIPPLMSDLTEWYDGYRFDGEEDFLFNPDMVLYFLKEYRIKNKYPKEMLDVNILSDYQKIRNIFLINEGENDRLKLLETLLEAGYIDFPLTRIFNLVHTFNDDDFLSLLFYMGLLTIQEELTSDSRFIIPNYVIKKLYFEYFAAIQLGKTQFAKSAKPIRQSVDAMVNDGQPEAFFKIVEYVLQENHSNRDEMVYGEKHLQTLMIALLFPYKAFKIHSEFESKRTYPDIFLEKIPDRKINYEIVLELKYVKKSGADTVDDKIAEAKTQLEGYMKTERFARPNVRGFYIVFLGGQVHKWDEVV